jgi:hypothetical protein
MRRRSLLKLGAGAAAVLALAGGGLALLRPGLDGGKLTASARTVFAACASGILDGTLPADPVARAAAIGALLGRIDDLIGGLPHATQSELSQLLALLASTAGRTMLPTLAVDWRDARVDQVQAALQSMRVSGLALRQQAYHALHEIVASAHFADAGTWPGLGYPGPRAV